MGVQLIEINTKLMFVT